MEKRAKIILLSLLSFLFLICLFWGGRQFRTVNVHMVQDASMETAAAAEIRTEDSSIKINAFQSDNGDSYIFLPSCAEGKRLAVDGGMFRYPAGRWNPVYPLPVDRAIL